MNHDFEQSGWPHVSRPKLAERTSDTPMRLPGMRDLLRGLQLALRLRCPHCGQGAVLTRWGGVRKRCRDCRFRFERTDDNYFGGAMFFGMLIGELCVALTLLLVMLLTWPEVPWDGIKYATTIGAVAVIPLLLPFAKVVWLSVDVVVRPVQPDEWS
jgi:uncharacterized protein (DUF983 family)